MGAIAIHNTGVLQGLELALLDQGFRWRTREAADPRVVLVTIDETDINHLGQYPVPDGVLAQAIEKISQHRPSVIGLNLYRNVPVEPGNAQLLQVFANTPNLFGVEKLSVMAGDQRVAPPPVLRDRGQVAASDIVLDRDGKVRRHLVSLRVEDTRRQSRTVMTLGTRLALAYLANRNVHPRRLGSSIHLGEAEFSPLNPNAGGYVNVDVGGYQILANFRKTGMPSIPLTQVLTGQVPTPLLRNKIVLIGSSSDSIDNLFYTPLTEGTGDRWSGTTLHAQLASEIVSAALDQRRPLMGLPGWIEAAWVFLWAGVGCWIGWRLRSISGIMVGLVGATGITLGLTYLMFLGGWWMILGAPLIALMSATGISRGHWIWKELNHSHQVLAAYAQTLELKVQERTQKLVQQNQELQAAKREADAANAAQARFLANVNHELRTPLSVILSCSELLGYDRTLSDKQRSRLSTINHNVQHLLDLINDVLELSKLGVGAVELEMDQIDVADFFGQLEAMFSIAAAEKNLLPRFELHALPSVIEVDGRKLRQVLINLLNNAIKFTEQGSVILSARLVESRLRCAVTDTGLGIAAEELPYLFQPFAQTETGRRSHQGTGLGLAISQEFVQLMGGHIEVQSEVGQGTTFRFDVPIQIPARAIASGISTTNSVP
jgi:CHASE2 domain-containing sensor protein/anti-sigma regulatory factor (Ser/Thr protein kinase)